MKKQLVALAWLVLTQSLVVAETVVEIIPVNNRPASEIEPLLAPMLQDDERIVANGDTLIVKSSPERLQTITRLVRKLDKPLTNLQISVFQSQDATADQLNAGGRFDVDVPMQQPDAARGRLGGYYNPQQSRYSGQNSQTIRTGDGETAYIKAGNSVPITSYQSYRDGYGYRHENRSTQLVEVTTGFAVTPRLAGQQVTLEVSPWSGRYSGQGQFQTQAAETTIRARLGEWVDIGGVEENGESSGSGLFSYNRQATQNTLHILVKVDVVD